MGHSNNLLRILEVKFHHIKYLFPLAVLLVSSATCSNKNCDTLNKNTCSVLKNFTVFDKTRTLHFKHLCSQVAYRHEGNRQAYSFFEHFHTYKMLVLGEVLVGRLPGVRHQGVSLNMEKLHFTGLNDWAGDRVAVSLRATHIRTGKQVTGNFLSSFLHYIPGTGSSQPADFVISNQGTLSWEQSAETGGNLVGAMETRRAGAIAIPKDNMDYPAEDHILHVVIKNLRTEEEIELRGPVLIDLEALLKNIPKPEFQTFKLEQAIGGDQWNWLSSGYQYKDCVYLRRKTKEEFNRRL